MINQNINQLTNNQSSPIYVSSNIQQKLTKSLNEIIDMLIMWGRYHRYRSQCGYRRTSAVFITNESIKNTFYIQEDIDIIDRILLQLKESPNKKQQQEYTIIEAYYKGIDLAIDGYDWSQKLTVRDIASYLNLPKSTVSNRKKAVEYFILQEVNK